MRVAFIQTYPIYHDLLSTRQWLQRENRDLWMPGILSGFQVDVELWAAGKENSTHSFHSDGLAEYTIRVFESQKKRGGTKKHYSDSLIEHAMAYDADLHVLKGTDGGVGIRLLRRFLLPQNKPFVFVIGGKYYTRHVPQANLVFYETEEQRQLLESPGWRLWRSKVPESRLMRLPKSVDTDLFHPMPDVRKRWDIISVGRIINRYKSYDPLGKLAEQADIAVAGGGPALEDLQEKYPSIEWLGHIPNKQLPDALNMAHAFMHAGKNDYFPRVIAEAMACGLPTLAFRDAIADDVIPNCAGLRLPKQHYVSTVSDLLRRPKRLRTMGRAARQIATENYSKYSTQEPLLKMFERMRDRQN